MAITELALTRRAVADNVRGLVGWSYAVIAASAFYLVLYPSIGSIESNYINAMPAGLRDALGMTDISTGAGYTQATVTGLMAMVLMSIAAIAWGAKAIAGDEESGALELTLAHAVSRRQTLWQRALAITAQLFLLSLMVFAVIAIIDHPARLGIGIGHVFAAALALFLLVMWHGAATLAAGAITGRKSVAIGMGTAVLALGYLANSIGAMSPSYMWLQSISPVHWALANKPLMNGSDWPHLALLVLISAVAMALAHISIERRDIGR